MSQNVGEEIVGLYLRLERGCDFIAYNQYTPDVQGEIDVVAVNFVDKTVYICEVAVHLVTGLQYVKDKRPDTEARFIKKFNKSIDYGEARFSGFTRRYMLWSPIVKRSGGKSAYDQMGAVERVQAAILAQRGVHIELVVNADFQLALTSLRAYAATTNEELKSPVLRLLQIEAKLDKHVKTLARKAAAPSLS